MNFKQFWKTTNTAFVLKNLIIAGVVGVALLFVAVFWLSKFTHHGEEVVVPTVTGMYVEEAEILAHNEGLSIQVIDSTYNRKMPLGTIVDQNPRAESHAKAGRAVYVIVNAKAIRKVPVPDLRDASYRQAEATLKAIGLDVDEVQYEPSEYKDLVLDVRYAGRSVQAGERISEGAKLTLVVGFGRGTDYVSMPDLTGKTVDELRTRLLSSRLILGAIEYDEAITEQNKDLFVAYRQSERAGESVLEGSRVDVWMTTSLEKAAASSQQSSEEDFF